MQTEPLKSYRVEFKETGNVYAFICSASGSQQELMAELKKCSNCIVTEYPRDRMLGQKVLQAIFETMLDK